MSYEIAEVLELRVGPSLRVESSTGGARVSAATPQANPLMRSGFIFTIGRRLPYPHSDSPAVGNSLVSSARQGNRDQAEYERQRPRRYQPDRNPGIAFRMPEACHQEANRHDRRAEPNRKNDQS